jgi:carbon storage regulator
MLVIGRKRDEKLIIDGRIEITVLKVGRNHVKFGIDAPQDVPIRAGRAPDASAESAAPVRDVPTLEASSGSGA